MPVTPWQELIALLALEEPSNGLRSVTILRELADELEAAQVHHARALGWTWQEIADALGVSKQAVHARFARADLAGRVRTAPPATGRTTTNAKRPSPPAPRGSR